MLNKRTLFSSFLILTLVLLLSCEKDENPESDLLGIWQIDQIMVDGQIQNLSQCETEATLKFEKYNLCKRFDACIDTTYNDSWSYTDGMINVLSFLPNAYNVESVSESELHLSSNEFNSLGVLIITEYKYLKID